MFELELENPRRNPLISAIPHLALTVKSTLKANGGPESALSNLVSRIAVLILKVEILNFEKPIFDQKYIKNLLEDQWPLGNI